MAAEREQLNTALKGRPDEVGAEIRALRERRSYLATRIDMLRAEQEALRAERKTLVESRWRG